MKTTHTKKLIQESIKYWEKVLESMGSNDTTTIEEGYSPKKEMFKKLSSQGHDFNDENKYELDLDVVTELYDKNGKYIGQMTNEMVDKYIDGIAKKYKLDALINSYLGSGGGWPDITFTGKKKDLRKMYIEWYCGGSKQNCDTFDDYFKGFSTPV